MIGFLTLGPKADHHHHHHQDPPPPFLLVYLDCPPPPPLKKSCIRPCVYYNRSRVRWFIYMKRRFYQVSTLQNLPSTVNAGVILDFFGNSNMYMLLPGRCLRCRQAILVFKSFLNSAIYNLTTLFLNGTLPCVNFMYAIMGDLPTGPFLPLRRRHIKGASSFNLLFG